MVGDERRPSGQVALYTHLRAELQSAGVLVESRALRRPEVLVRRVRYLGVVVDERVLTRAYGMTPRPTRMHAFLPIGGSISHGPGIGSPVPLGTVLLLHPHHQHQLRFENADFLEIEWDTDRSVELPTALGVSVDTEAAAAVFDGDLRTDQRRRLRIFFDTFRRAGVPLPDFDVDTMFDRTTEREERIAEALRQQLQALRETNARMLGDLAGLSPRQMQRLYAAFCLKYSFSLSSWRDTRNRWRLLFACLLLSRPDLTIALIADEVGYGSTPALGRAFVKAGLPPPAEVRRLLLRGIDC